MMSCNGGGDQNRLSPASESENHANQFGVVRLVLAAMVILSHAFPLTLGFGRVDPLEALTGTTSLGDLAVDCFFVLSGYLVTQSLARSLTISSYLLKRVRRIYPGFAIAVVASVALGFVCGGRWQGLKDTANLILSLTTLRQPALALAFAGNVYQIPNGALWTIQYEFACYLLPVVFLLLRWHRRTWLIVGCSVSLILLSDVYPRHSGSLLAPLHNPMRLSGIFLAGMAWQGLMQNRPVRQRLAFLAGLTALGSLFWGVVAGLGIAYPGGYALLTLCHHRGRSALSRVGRRNDASYGTYLYGWPVESFVIWLLPGIGPWTVFALATPVALTLGWASWMWVEAPFLRRRLRATVTWEPADRNPERPGRHAA